MTAGMADGLKFVAIPGFRGDAIEEALGVSVETTKPFGLQAVGDHAKEEMPGQVVGGLAVICSQERTTLADANGVRR
jgi:hypothetical protein